MPLRSGRSKTPEFCFRWLGTTRRPETKNAGFPIRRQRQKAPVFIGVLRSTIAAVPSRCHVWESRFQLSDRRNFATIQRKELGRRSLRSPMGAGSPALGIVEASRKRPSHSRSRKEGQPASTFLRNTSLVARQPAGRLAF